jgi:hypoxanthine-guanine phosphoribosyltransferase
VDAADRDSLEAPGILTPSDRLAPAAARQGALPSIWPPPIDVRSAAFAHPAEADLAAIFDRYGVRWAYEPTSFALEFGDDGRPSEMFTPDFYLPDERHYIELTTMRQRLVTRKNRKLRRLRELYPDIRIKLLYRRDYHQLVDCHLAREPEGYSPKLGALVADADGIAARIRDLAAALAAEEAAAGALQPPLALVADPGAARFARDLRDALEPLGVRPDWDVVEESGGAVGADLRLRRSSRGVIRGRRVVVVASVVSSGLSTWRAVQWLGRAGAADTAVYALVDREEARLVVTPVRQAGFVVRGDLVVGYGLHLRPAYSALPELRSMTWRADEP